MIITLKNIVSSVQSLINSFAQKEATTSIVSASINQFQLGDVFVESWGYEQTNIDFYQVIKVNKASVILKKIAYNTVKFTGWASDEVEPRKHCFLEDKTYIKRIREGSMHLNGIAHGILTLHKEGQTHYRSWYA